MNKLFIIIYYFRIDNDLRAFAEIAKSAGYPCHIIKYETEITAKNDLNFQEKGCWLMTKDNFQVTLINFFLI